MSFYRLNYILLLLLFVLVEMTEFTNFRIWLTEMIKYSYFVSVKHAVNKSRLNSNSILCQIYIIIIII